MRDPFRTPARHRKPRPAVTGALELITSAAVIAAVFLVLATVSRPAGHADRFPGMVARAATHAAQTFTPARPPLTSGKARKRGTGHYRVAYGTSRTGRETGRLVTHARGHSRQFN